jgi:hypothetical protein
MKRVFVPPSTAGISEYYNDLKTKYYIKASDLFKAVILVTVILIILHIIY